VTIKKTSRGNFHALSQDFEKLLRRFPSTYVLFIGLNKSSCQALFSLAFFLENSKYLKSYHGKTKLFKILNFAPFSKTSFLRHCVIASNKSKD